MMHVLSGALDDFEKTNVPHTAPEAVGAEAKTGQKVNLSLCRGF